MRFWLTVLVLGILLALAFRRGGQPERIVASLLSLAFAVELARNTLTGAPAFRTLDLFMMAVDSAVLLGMIGVAVQANRLWPMVVAALQLVILTAHISLLLQLKGIVGAYWGMSVLPIYPQFACLLGGILAHMRRRKRYGPYPDWRK